MAEATETTEVTEMAGRGVGSDGDSGGSGGGDARGDVGGGVPDGTAVSRFVEAFASALVDAGMTRMPARVFAALLASEDGVMTSAELGEQLRVSPAAVSGAVRYLAGVTMVSREREPGSRRERYRLHSDQWYEVLTNREGLIRRWDVVLGEGIATVGADSRPGRRIAETREFFRFVQNEFDTVLERWRKHREEVFGAD